MSIEVWGLMPKNQIDPETVEEAITRIVAEHEHDPTSHMGVDEAIDMHRKSEVIDHLASSVYDDKFAYDRNVVDVNLGNLSVLYANELVERMGLDTAVLLSSGVNTIAELRGSLGDIELGTVYNFEKNPRFIVNIMLSANSYQIGYIIVGETDEGRGFGFKVVNDKLYGLYFKSDYSEVLTELLTISVNIKYKLEVRVFFGDRIEYVVNNDTPIVVASPLLPANMSFGVFLPLINITNTSGAGKYLLARSFHWETDL